MQRMEPIIKEKINQATKHIKIPQVQFLDKADDKLVDVQRQMPVAQTMQETMEVSPLQFNDKVSDDPVVAQRQISMETVQKSTETPQLQDADKVVDVPVVLVAQVPHVHVVAKTPEISQLQITDKMIDVPLVSAMQVPRVCECKQVKKDATGWTVVTRNKRQRKMVQIFVKVDEAKVTLMDVSLTDGKIEDVIRQVQKGEDVYVTMQGKVLRRNEKLKSCGVTDGCTIQVTSRMRGWRKTQGQEEQSGEETRHEAGATEKRGSGDSGEREGGSDPDVEETEEYRKIVDDVSGGSDEDMEWKMRYWASKLRERPGADILECGLRWAVEARRKGRDKQQEQRRQAKQGGKNRNRASKASKCVSAKNNSWGRRERKTLASQR